MDDYTQSMMETMRGKFQQGVDTAEKLGASSVKFVWRLSTESGPSFEAGRLKHNETSQRHSFYIEALVGRRSATTFGNRPEDFDTLLARAVTLAKVGSDVHFDAYPSPAPFQKVQRYDPAVSGLTLDRMIEEGARIVDRLKAYQEDLHIVVGVSKSEAVSLIVTSGGLDYSTEKTSWSMGGMVQRTDGTDMLFAGDGRGWRKINEFFDSEAVAEKMIRDLQAGETVVEPPSGKTKLLIPPETLGRFLSAFVMGINGRNVAKGDSPLAGRIGEKVFSEHFTLTDDPHLDFSGGSAEVDDDGIPTRRNRIVENGVLKMFLYDLDTAGLAGTEPTGNSDCHPYSLVVEPGETDSETLISGIEDGILVKFMLGFGQSNIINGDFSANLGLGYRVRNGKIQGRVKNTMIAGNLYDLFASDDVVFSSDIDPMRRMPWAIVPGVSVSAGQ